MQNKGEEKELNRDDDLELAMLEAHKELTEGKKDKPEPEEKEEVQEAAKEDAETPQADEPSEEVEAKADDSEDDDEEAPQSWEKAKHDLWKKMPKEARDYWRKRETDLTKLVTTKANEFERGKKSVEGVFRAAEPYIEQWGLQGKTVEQGVTQALALMAHLQKADKFELAKRFLKASGKSVKDLEASPENPLQEKLESLERKLAERDEAEASQFENHRRDSLAKAYSEFASTKNEYGVEQYPSCKVPAFAEAMGSLVTKLASEIPGATFNQLVEESYKRLGGQIHTGTPQPRSPNQQKQLKTAMVSAHAKGKSGAKANKFDSSDDAWEATFREYGLTD